MGSTAPERNRCNPCRQQRHADGSHSVDQTVIDQRLDHELRHADFLDVERRLRLSDGLLEAWGTNFNIPVVFYGQLMAAAVGIDANKNAALDHNMQPVKLVELAKKSGT
jgi:hypothetical protein